jgi:glycosyltransferase involved in cell wall biosynthesis
MVLSPFISVLLPAYNAEKFLKEAIQSILNQTYSNFEFIIINDGSTDKTQEIIDAYADPRIHCILHKENKGLIQSLNEGILCAKGVYIVRMDADDIAFANRIQVQVDFMESNPQITAVGSHAIFFNENKASPIENWALDQKTNTQLEIKKTLIWENCLIHPSICFRTNVVKDLLYDPSQKNYEDYDLWLRMIANNYAISKINEPLLYYRVQAQSITQSSIRKSNFYLNKVKVKIRFLRNCVPKTTFNFFIFSILISLLFDLMMGIAKMFKSKI